jgi:glucose/arabinose dehydrogenase
MKPEAYMPKPTLSYSLSAALLAVSALFASQPSNAATQPAPTIKLTKIATASNPVQVLPSPNSGSGSGTASVGTDGLLVVEQAGRIRPITNASVGSAVFDLSTQVSDGNEQGLLGAAFSLDGRWLYTNHTNKSGNTEISATPWNGTKADMAARVVLLKVDQPYANHNGGGLVVDADGVLWIGLGDGGSAGDPQNRAQNVKTFLGKMLRIIPTPSASKPYTIPTGNLPSTTGAPEIWGFGLRNPWRFSIDASTGTLWIGDVGQNTIEEIDAVSVTAKAPNFGWRRREGNTAFKNGKRFRLGDSVEPVFSYPHSSGGCSVTGGVVYRGAAIPELRGMYLYSDFCDSTVRALPGVRTTRTTKSQSLGVEASQISSFGVDPSGEVYVTSLEGPIYRLDKK